MSSISISTNSKSIYSLYNLETEYVLNESKYRKITTQFLKDLKKGKTHILPTQLAVILAIEEDFRDFISFAIPLLAKQLDTPTVTKKLTYLHIAVIYNRTEIAAALLQAGVNPNARDFHNWTPLMHAALFGNSAMINCLLSKADPHLKDNNEGDYKKILELVNPKKINKTERINLDWEDEKGVVSGLTQGKFYELTKATFADENTISIEDRIRMWLDDKIGTKALETTSHIVRKIVNALKMQYSTQYLKNPSTHLLKKVTTQVNEKRSCGFGIFAQKAFKKGEIVGEYLGKIEKKSENNSPDYLMDLGTEYVISADNSRSPAAIFNDGFPNVIGFPIYHSNGLPERLLFIAAENIKPGDQFLVNYHGGHPIKIGPYIEFRSKELRDYVKKNLNEFVPRFLSQNYLSTLDEFIQLEKVYYITQTPPIQIMLCLEQIIPIATLQKLHQIGRNTESFTGTLLDPKHIQDELNMLPKIEDFPKTREICIKIWAALLETLSFTRCLNFPFNKIFARALMDSKGSRNLDEAVASLVMRDGETCLEIIKK